jgi:hypothetical protein
MRNVRENRKIGISAADAFVFLTGMNHIALEVASRNDSRVFVQTLKFAA